jgi:adenylate cyclase
MGALMAWATLHPWVYKLFGVLLATLTMLALGLWTPKTFQGFDEKSDALTWNLPHAAHPERRVVIVDIDEKSIQALGAWPWSRSTMSQLVNALNDYSVGLKVFDVVMPDAKDGDPLLQNALLSGAPSLGGQIFSIDQAVTVRGGVLAGAEASMPCAASTQEAYGFIANAPEIASAFASVGHLTPVIDPDGAVRKVPAWLCFEGQSYPALSVSALMQLGQAGKDSNQNNSGSYWLKGHLAGEAPWTLKFKAMPEFALPLNDQGQIRVSYRLSRSDFVSLSAVDVIEHKVPKELLDGVWALVGSTAFGAGDAIPTPHGGAEGGLEVHAQIISAALDEATPFTPIGSTAFQGMALLSCLLVLMGLSGLSSPRDATSPEQWHQREWMIVVLPFAGLGLVLGFYALHAVALLEFNYWIQWSWSASVVGLSALVLSAEHLAQLRWQRTRLFENMSRYMSDSVAQEVALSAESEEVSARQSEVIVMSANLRNFDRFCASQSPELSAKLLHQYLFLMNIEVQAAGGELQHIQGTEVMAVWRETTGVAVLERISHLPQTLWTQSQNWLSAWAHTETEQLRLEEGSKAALSAPIDGLVPTTYISDAIRLGRELELEMGLEQGFALVGSMGPSQRRVNAVLGEPVQVAHALRGMCSDLAYPALMGPVFVKSLIDCADPKEELASRLFTKLGDFMLPGLTESRMIYACGVNVESVRLHLVDNTQHRAA